MTKNLLTQQRGESLEAFITRVRNMSAEERLNAAEQQQDRSPRRISQYHEGIKLQEEGLPQIDFPNPLTDDARSVDYSASILFF